MSKKKNRPRRKPSTGRVVEVDPLERFRRAAAGVERARVEYLDAMEAAHAGGRSWGEIGQAVGVTRQAVQQQRSVLRRAFDRQ